MKVFPITGRRYARSIKRRSKLALLVPYSWPQQFTPFSQQSTPADSCVLANAIPKSGTHLLKSIANYLGKWENIRVHVNHESWDTEFDGGGGRFHDCLIRYSVRKLRNGQLVSAHLPWSEGVENTLAQQTPARRVKHLFMCRDPRDTIISRLNEGAYLKTYVTDGTTRRHRQFMLENFANDDERLTYLLKRRQPSAIMSYEPWLHSPNCLALKFEDLYPDIVATRDRRLGDTLKKLFEYLEIDASAIDLQEFHDNVNGKSITASDVEDKVGQYKRVFKDQHYALIDNQEFENVLQTFGYGW